LVVIIIVKPKDELLMPTKFKFLAGISTAFFLFVSFSLFAQTTITGRVLGGSDKLPIAGATVQVKGAKTSALTGNDGTFSISSAKKVSELVITSIGYSAITVPVSGASVGDVLLTVSTTSLNDVVVTGYTSQRKKDLTGAVAVVNVTSFKSVPGGNSNDLLQGQAAGVTVISAGVPGGYANVRVRGVTSLGNSDPLYIIDGVQIPDGFQNLDVNDIESLQILKDAASCAIYGVRGSNGVVIVTTKKGRPGKARIQYDGYYGTQIPLSGNVWDIANPTNSGNALYAEFKNSGLAFNSTNYLNSQYGYGPTPTLYDYLTPINTNAGGPNTDPSTYALYTNEITKTNKAGTDWFHAIFQQAPIQSHTVSASGANDKSSYYFSVGYFDQQGTLLNTFLKRYDTRVNTVFNVADHVRVGENLMFFFKQSPGFPGSTNQNEGNAISMSYRMSPLIPVYDVAGNFAGTQVKGLGNPQNPVATLARSANNVNDTWQIMGNVFAEVDFLKHFTIRTSYGGEYQNNYNYNFTYTSFENTENNTNPNQFQEQDLYRTNWTWTNTLTYSNTWGNSNLKALIGTEAVSDYQRGFGATRGNYYITDPNNLTVDPNLWTLNFGNPGTQTNTSSVYNTAYPIQSTIYSLFARADYAYKDRYLLSATIRRDESSIFAPDVNVGYFPSVSAGWRISEEDFMKGATWLQDLKLRGGWGKLGSLSNAKTTNQFNLYGQLAASSSYDIDGTSTTSALGSYASQYGNAETTWEKDAVTDIGLDASFLNRWELTVDWFHKAVTGLLFQPSIPNTVGGGTAPFDNVGNITNTGWDGSLTYHGGSRAGIKYDLTAIFSTYVNNVQTLGPSTQYIDELSEGSNRFGAFSRLAPGHAVGAFYGYKVVGLFQSADEAAKSNQPDAAIGRFKYADVNGDGKISDSDRTWIGNPNPKFTLGFNLAVSYKAFDLTAFFYGSFGNDVANYVKYWTDFPQVFDAAISNRAALQSFGEPGANGKTPILERSANSSNSTVFNSYYIESGSYFRCKQLQIGYTFPASMIGKAGISRLRIYVQAANLFTITKYDGLDPELQTSDPNNNTNFGIDFGNYPANQRNYNVGVQLGF
jgi:TonB-dependent starch-binding outer membrane protein SusC